MPVLLPRGGGAAAPQPGLTSVGHPHHPPHIGDQLQEGAAGLGQKALVICRESSGG